MRVSWVRLLYREKSPFRETFSRFRIIGHVSRSVCNNFHPADIPALHPPDKHKSGTIYPPVLQSNEPITIKCCFRFSASARRSVFPCADVTISGRQRRERTDQRCKPAS